MRRNVYGMFAAPPHQAEDFELCKTIKQEIVALKFRTYKAAAKAK